MTTTVNVWVLAFWACADVASLLNLFRVMANF